MTMGNDTSWTRRSQKIELRKRSWESEVEDEMSSFKEVKGIWKKLAKEGNVEVVENTTFMTMTRRKRAGAREVERRDDLDVNPGA